jgi:hypothetical protein|tara:strand:- start:6382 stop:9072 length:2691 start_codon:yes stop_codon:yes gene_type:complete
MASLNSNSISGITTEIFGGSHAVNKKYADDNIPTLPDSTIGGGKFLVTTDGVDITWSDISNVEEFSKVGISTYYIPEMASSIHVEGVGGGAAGDNQGGTSSATDQNSRVIFTCCDNFSSCMYNDVAYGDGKYLIAGDCNFAISTDTIHWEKKSIGQGSSYESSIRGVGYHDGFFLAGAMASYMCSASSALFASTDTTHWQLRTITKTGNSSCFCSTGYSGLKYLNDKWILIDGCKTSIHVSTDTIHWELRTGPGSCLGGHNLHWSGNYYGYRNHCHIPVTSTDSIHWFRRTIPYHNTVCYSNRCMTRSFTYAPTTNLWITAYGTYNNQQCPTGSGYYYGQHLATSTDTIHWELRTLAFAEGHEEGYTDNSGQFFTEVTEVGGRLYLSSFCMMDPHNYPKSQSCSNKIYFPLTSTDAIHWDPFINAAGCNSPFMDNTGSSQPNANCICAFRQYYNLNNRLFSGAYCTGVLSPRLSSAGNGGNSGNYAKFSINPSKVIDRKLEINVGSGGATSTGTSCNGCAGAGTTISYRSQEGTTSYYFNGTDSQIQLGNNDAFILGTGDFTLEFFVKFSSANGAPTSTDVIFDSLTTGSNGFRIVRYNVADTNQNKIRFFTDGDYRATADVVVENDTWVHVAVVRSGRTKIYVDGKEGEFPDTYIDFNNYCRPDFKLGVNRNSDSGFLHGYLSSIRLTKGHARYACLGESPASDFNPPPPDLNRSNRTVFLSGVGSTIADQTGNGVISNTNVSLCTSTCLPEIKINHTINGGSTLLFDNTQSCTMSPLRFNFGAKGQDDPGSYTIQDIFNPFQPSGGGAGALTGETGGSSGALLNYSTEIKATGGASPQSGVTFQSAVYGTGGGGGNPGISGAPGFRGGGGGGAGEGSSACGGKGGDGFVKITWW